MTSIGVGLMNVQVKDSIINLNMHNILNVHVK
jgi:hypothetical protein